MLRFFTMSFINSVNQLVDILTKSLRGCSIGFIFTKFGAYGLICSSLRESVDCNSDVEHSSPSPNPSQ